MSGADPTFAIGRKPIGDYMDRWVLETPWFSVRLHKIQRDDDARALHDHPWDFVSLILWGRYRELEPGGFCPCAVCGGLRSRTRRIGPLNIKRAEALHRLEVVRGPVWTLCFTGPRRRQWGFQDPERGWVAWDEYGVQA